MTRRQRLEDLHVIGMRVLWRLDWLGHSVCEEYVVV